jgi:outer membrane protein OmpA-like peptidoglycan-associated protein
VRRAYLRHLLPLLCLWLLFAGCAAPKSVIMLLPEGGKPSGEVTVTNASGSQVLNQSWQSVEISGTRGEPTAPVVLEQKAAQQLFAGATAGMPAPPVHYLLYFKLGTAELLPESLLLLPEIVKVVKERRPAQLSVVGHADTVGSVEFNFKLGLRRATSVAGLLTSLGAGPASIETASRGKSDLLVKTTDQTLEPRNRRAEVTVR